MKIAILGAWHVHAPGYTDIAKKYGEVVGVFDENPAFARNLAEAKQIPLFPSREALLASGAEAVIVCSSTDRHADDIAAAAEAGKHIFTEKVLALTEEECARVKAAVEKAGVRFVISFPHKFMAGPMTVKAAVDAGRIGKVHYLRYRNCHSGSIRHWLPAHFYDKAQCGGGAMIDLGAHGMYLAAWFLGEPTGYRSAFTHVCRDEKDALLNPDGLEDNAATLMTYPNGAIALNETGFVSIGSPQVLEVGGDLGYLTWQGGGVSLVTDGGRESLPLLPAQEDPCTVFCKGGQPPFCGRKA